jgi:hypothetical protein
VPTSRDAALDAQAAANARRLHEGKTREERQAGLSALTDLADRGSAFACYELGQWHYASEREQDKDKEEGLRRHIQAAGMGYIRSLLAIQAHEDPLGLKYDLLEDPKSLGLDGPVAASVKGSRYLRFALYWAGMRIGAKFYARRIAEALAADAARGTLHSHPASLSQNLFRAAYDLLDDYYAALRRTFGPGSPEAIESNSAIASGFRSWSDLKSRSYLRDVCGRIDLDTKLQSEIKPFVSTDAPLALPGRSPAPLAPIDGLRLMEFTSKIETLVGARQLDGIDYTVAILTLVVLSSYRLERERAAALAETIAGGYRALGQMNGVVSYYNLLFRGSRTVTYESDWKEAHRDIDWSLGYGSSKSTRSTIKFRANAVEHVVEERLWNGFSPPGGNIRNTHTDVARTRQGFYVLSERAGTACVSMMFQSCSETTTKKIEINRTERTEHATKDVPEFDREWVLPFDELNAMSASTDPERSPVLGVPATHAESIKAASAMGRTAPGVSWDHRIDEWRSDLVDRFGLLRLPRFMISNLFKPEA